MSMFFRHQHNAHPEPYASFDKELGMVVFKDRRMNIKDYNELRKRAAKIRNWYEVHGEWSHLTQAEVRKLIRKGIAVRKATVDEELELDGI